MSKMDFATTLIVGICLALLAFLIYKAVKLYNGPAEPIAIEEPDGYYNNEYQDAADTYTDADSLAAAGTLDDNLSYDDVTPSDNGSYEDSEMDNDAVKEETRPAPSTTTSSTSDSKGEGDYLVIAGSYQQKINAQNQVARLRKLGYSDAGVEIFNHGALAVALVDRFYSYSDALALHRELKGKGIEVFIKKKR